MAGTRTRDWAEVDFYAVLGVPIDATDDDIGRAYRALAKQLHPDVGATASEADAFKDLAAAYAVLRDAKIRRDYDLVRRERRRDGTSGPASPFARGAVSPIARGSATGTRPAGAFRAAKPRQGWTRGRSWLAVIGGALVTILGVVVAIVVFGLRSRAGDPGVESDPARDITLAIVALKLVLSGPVFIVLGVLHLRGRPLPHFVVIGR